MYLFLSVRNTRYTTIIPVISKAIRGVIMELKESFQKKKTVKENCAIISEKLKC